MQSILPTTLELAGRKKPESIFFDSILDMARAGKGEEDRDIYGAMFSSQRMIRTKEWKLLLYPNANVIRLYHRLKDPDEINDVAGVPVNLPVIKDLYERFKRLQAKHDDPLNLDKLVDSFLAGKQ